MAGTRLYNFSLAQPQFEVKPFQAVAFEPKERPNINILADAFDTLEERENKYSDAIGAMNLSFAQLKDNLSQDKKTLDWFENFKKKYQGTISDFAKLGDYYSAASFGKRLASEMLTDGELKGNLYSYETYKKDHDAIKQKADAAGDVIGLYFYEQENKYDPDNIKWIKDENGNIIGAEEYKPNREYFEPIDYVKDVWSKGFGIINADQTSKSSSRNSSTQRGNEHFNKSSGSESSHSTNISEIKASEVLKSFDLVVKGLGIDVSRIKYDFDARCKWRDKLQDEYDNLSDSEKTSTKGQDLLYQISLYDSVLVHNGIRDYKSYFADMVAGGDTAKAVADLMAYKHYSVKDSKGSSSGYTTYGDKGNEDEQNTNTGLGRVINAIGSWFKGDSKSSNPVRQNPRVTGGRRNSGNAAADALIR